MCINNTTISNNKLIIYGLSNSCLVYIKRDRVQLLTIGDLVTSLKSVRDQRHGRKLEQCSSNQLLLSAHISQYSSPPMEALANTRHGNQSRRSLLAMFLHCLPLLFCIFAIQITCSTSQESSAVPESGAIPCSDNSDCMVAGPGYHCSATHGVCIRRTCHRDCTDATGGPVCGRMSGIVQTYRNLCELKLSECEANEEILVVRNGPCETLPPPQIHSCEEQKKHYEAYWTPELYLHHCIMHPPTDLEGLRNCSSPVCTSSGYALKQCANGWCWCTTRDGDAIADTLMQRMPTNFCSLREGCDGNHRDGEVFTPASGCGICQCLNGVVTCFENYIPDSSGKLNATQVALLKDELVQIYFFQYNHNKHVLIDIRRFHEEPEDISDTQKARTLEWKFEYYDMGGDGELSQAEEHVLRMELFHYVKCKSFFNHITDVIDADGNGRISAEEWYQFFEMEHTSADLASSSASGTHTLEVQMQQSRQRRDVLKRRPIHRRKTFQYVLH